MIKPYIKKNLDTCVSEFFECSYQSKVNLKDVQSTESVIVTRTKKKLFVQACNLLIIFFDMANQTRWKTPPTINVCDFDKLNCQQR